MAPIDYLVMAILAVLMLVMKFISLGLKTVTRGLSPERNAIGERLMMATREEKRILVAYLALFICRLVLTVLMRVRMMTSGTRANGAARATKILASPQTASEWIEPSASRSRRHHGYGGYPQPVFAAPPSATFAGAARGRSAEAATEDCACRALEAVLSATTVSRLVPVHRLM